MSGRNGSGNFSFTANTWNPAVPEVAILSDDWNVIAAEIQQGLTTSLASDGQTTASARIPFAQGISVPAGSLSSPSMAFISDLDTGFYSPGAGQIAAVCNGTLVFTVTDAGITFNIPFASISTEDLTVTGDTILGSDATDTLTVNATGTWAGPQTFNGPVAFNDPATFTDTVTVPNASFTNAKLANMATQTIKGRTTAGSGAPEDLTATQATAILDSFVGDSGSGGTKGLVPAPASGDAVARKVLAADGTWQSTEIKARGLFTGASGATVAARGISCTRNGTGDYTFTLSPALASADYQVIPTPMSSGPSLTTPTVTSKTTTTFNVTCNYANLIGSTFDPIDPTQLSIVVID